MPLSLSPTVQAKKIYLDRLKRERLEAAADEAKRLKNIAREKKEAAATSFYDKLDGKPLTKRLNTGPAGSIGIMEGEFLEGGDDNGQ